jgi:hypothetical protein
MLHRRKLKCDCKRSCLDLFLARLLQFSPGWFTGITAIQIGTIGMALGEDKPCVKRHFGYSALEISCHSNVIALLWAYGSYYRGLKRRGGYRDKLHVDRTHHSLDASIARRPACLAPQFRLGKWTQKSLRFAADRHYSVRSVGKNIRVKLHITQEDGKWL